jgi:dihydrofolate synthase/folylpolyglutamate synthase
MPDELYFESLRAIVQPIPVRDYPKTLEPMAALLTELGNPQETFPAIVVAGSVGKGTACYRLAQILYANNLHVGLYTSPHLHSFRERFVINTAMITKGVFVEGVAAVREAASHLPYRYSTFEMATALAFWWFARNHVHIAVLEVGLGGRYDAVNTVPNVLAILTPIELEHAAILGGTLPAIAAHKAGVIQPGGYAISVKQKAEVQRVLEQETNLKKATLQLNGTRSDRHQGSVLGLAAWQNLRERGLIPWRPFKYFLETDALPGRLEQIQIARRDVVLDGAHTPMAAHRLRREIDERFGPNEPVRIIVGMLQDKAVQDFLTVFDVPRYHIVITQATGHRALSSATIRAQFQPRAAQVEIAADLNEALSQIHTMPECHLAVTGSLRMVAAAREAYGLVPPQLINEVRMTRTIFEGSEYLVRLRIREESAPPSDALAH